MAEISFRLTSDSMNKVLFESLVEIVSRQHALGAVTIEMQTEGDEERCQFYKKRLDVLTQRSRVVIREHVFAELGIVDNEQLFK